MSFGGVFKNGITRSLSPFLLLHNGDGTSQSFVNGLVAGVIPFTSGQWTEIYSAVTDSVTVLEVSDATYGFWIGIGPSGSEEELFYVEAGFAGTTSLELKIGDRLVVKPDETPIAQTFTLFNFYKPSVALNNVDTGRALIFHNGAVRSLKSSLSINGKTTFMTGAHDPQIVPTFGFVGWFFLKSSAPGGLFLKTDNGISSNWRRIGRDVEITSWDQLTDVDLEGLLDGMILIREDRPSPILEGTGPMFVPGYMAEPIRKPLILTPVNGAVNVPAVTTISTSVFSSIYLYDHVSTHWQISRNVDFTDLILDEVSTIDLTSKTIELQEDTQYWVRIKYKDSGNFESRWTYTSFRIQLEYVLQPTITSPANQQTNVPISGALVASDFISVPDPNISHDETDWMLASDENFTNIILSSMNDTVNLNTISYSGLDYSTTYFAKVKYRSYIPTYDDSEWSPTIIFSTIPSP